MAPAKSTSPKDLLNGAILQCVEAATLGMPFEVWKTHMGRNRSEGTFEACSNLYKKGGYQIFWKGTSAKMVESASKGGVLLFAKESIARSMLSMGFSETATGFASGAGAGVCQVGVMGPCTFLVTAVVTGDKNASVVEKSREVWAKEGIKGFYPGGTAIAFRQATNWASRQGFTELLRGRAKIIFHGKDDAKLTVAQEAMCGIIGGALSCWNHPFEVARIEMQAAAASGQERLNLVQVIKMIVKEQGAKGLFQGIVPRIGLGIWQTLFMVTGAKLIKQYMP